MAVWIGTPGDGDLDMNGGVLTTSGLNDGQLAGFRNALINGEFAINQRAPASNADDTYAHDRWYALTQSNAIAVSTLSDVEDGLRKMARLTQSNATPQRMGYAQIIEGANCKHLRGKTVTFRFRRFRCSSAQAIRFAVLQWTSTEDSVTSDVVNDWTSSTYTAGNFFISNITASVDARTPDAATLTDGADITVTLGSTFNNLIVMAWTEGTAAQNVTLDLGEAQLEIGGVYTPFERRSFAAELVLCRRYFQKVFSWSGVVSTSANIQFALHHPGMRSAPSVSATAALDVTNHVDATFTQSSASIAINENVADGGRYEADNFTGMTAAAVYSIRTFGGAITLSAEL